MVQAGPQVRAAGCAGRGDRPGGADEPRCPITSLADARLPAALCATLYYFCKRGISGTIVVGMLVYLPLHIGLGW